MSNTPSNTEAWDLWLESITGGHHPASLAKFARAVLAKWGTPQPVAREPAAWRLTNTAYRKPKYEYFEHKSHAEVRQEQFNQSVDDGERIDVRNMPETWDVAIDAAIAAQGGKV